MLLHLEVHHIMNNEKIDETWRLQKAKMMIQFNYLHDEDFHYDYGKKDCMITTLRQKIGKSREEFDAYLLTLIIPSPNLKRKE